MTFNIYPAGGMMRGIFIALICLVWFQLFGLTIHEAVQNKDFASIKTILADNPSLLDTQDTNGNTPLHIALRDTIPEFVTIVLSYKPRLDIKNKNGVLPIHLAAQKHSLRIVQQMVAAGADIKATDTRMGGIALHWAADGGNLEVISFLIDKGLDPNQDSFSQWKPVDRAVSRGHLDALKLLLEKGARLPAPNVAEDYFFIVAINSGNLALVSFLIDKGFDPNFKTSNGDVAINQPIYRNDPAMLRLLIQQGAAVNGTFDSNGFAPLHAAALMGSAKIAQILLDNGADLDIAKPGDGSSPLQFAIELKKNEVALYLIDQGADINFRDNSGITPFNAAVLWENNEIASLLLDKGVDYIGSNCIATASCPNPPAPPLLNAASRNPLMLKVLLDKGVDINMVSSDGSTALMNAVYGDSLQSIQLLIKRKADLNKRNNRGMTALMMACQYLNINKAQLLMQAGCDINLRNNDGKNALHIAAIKGDTAMVNLLLSKNIAKNIKDRDKYTPLDYAMRYAQSRVVKILQAHSAKTRFKQPALAQDTIDFTSGKNLTGVWYLEHSSMAVRNSNNLLIFDYWLQQPGATTPSLYNGCINPSEIKDLNVYVFVSHSDMDHFDKHILEWQAQIPHLKFIFGFRPETTADYRQNRYTLPQYTYVSKDSSVVLDGMQIKTFSSPIDDGSGFYVELNGLKFIHSGDAVNQSKPLPSDFSRSVDHLANHVTGLDFAFMPMLGCGMNDSEALDLGTDYFIRKLNPAIIIPMHAGGSEYRYAEWANSLKTRGIENKTRLFQNPGDHFSIIKQ